MNLECFDIQDNRDYKPLRAYQYAHLHIIYTVKQDLYKKAYQVYDGSRVAPRDLTIWMNIVKGIADRMLDVIAHYWKRKSFPETLAII